MHRPTSIQRGTVGCIWFNWGQIIFYFREGRRQHSASGSECIARLTRYICHDERNFHVCGLPQTRCTKVYIVVVFYDSGV